MRMNTVMASGLLVMVLGAACAKKDETPEASAPPSYPPPGYGAYPQTGYPQQTGNPQQTGYPQQAGYPQQTGNPQQTGYPQQTGTPQTSTPTTPPPPTGTMATPGPLALPCQNDSACGLARCNVQYQKCAFPCQGAADCAQGASCNTMTGFCLPGGQ